MDTAIELVENQAAYLEMYYALAAYFLHGSSWGDLSILDCKY